MRYGTYFPALAACGALVLLAISGTRTVGQTEVRITDEPAPGLEDPATTIKVQPAAEAPATAPTGAPGKAAPAAPANKAVVGVMPNNAQDINRLIGDVGRL